MKKALFVFILTLISFSSFAQPYPYPTRCQVAAVDQWNRVIAYFGGNAPMCRDGLAHCNNTIRRNGWYGARCVVMRNRW